MGTLKAAGLRKLTLLGGLVLLAALATAVMAGTAGAHHGKGGHADGGSGGGKATSATVVTSGGLVTPGTQAVSVDTDNKNRLALQALRDVDGRPTFQAEIKLTETQDNPGDCNGNLTLIAQLTDLEQTRNFLLLVDKNSLGLTSGGHNTIKLSWGEHDPDDGLKKHFKLVISGSRVEGGPADGPTRNFVLSGGTVMVTDKTGPVKDHTELVCPNMDTIAVIVVST